MALRFPPFLVPRDPIALARFDPDLQAPVCGADDEAGEVSGRIGADAAARFEGYSQEAETERRSCATSSNRAMLGRAPTISCDATRTAFTPSSIRSAR